MLKNILNRLKELKGIWETPLTLTEKILMVHASKKITAPAKRGQDYRFFQPDRVAMQDATAQMALLQFMLTQKETTAVPASVHCDHLIQARDGAEKDTIRAARENAEVYGFLKSVSLKYGIDYWEPNEGIIHQIVLENYAFPGGMMVGTDSHTPNAGGMGMLAVGVGGADAVDVLSGMDWELLFPKVIGVKLTGALREWTAPKDIILYLLGKLTVKGGTGAVIEYFGPGAKSLSCTGKAAVCNMGAELGATTSIFPPDEKTVEYLNQVNRGELAEEVIKSLDLIRADEAVYEDPEKYYDQVIEIDLDQLEPHVNGPFSPDKAVPLSRFKAYVKENAYPSKLSAGLIGSCSNASFEDFLKVSAICRCLSREGISLKVPLLIAPGSKMVLETARAHGLLEPMEKMGAVILSNACGPCIGQWDRKEFFPDKPNSIMTSFNRNFSKRNDGNPNTNIFIASPELITLFCIDGDLTKNPLREERINASGEKIYLSLDSSINLKTVRFIDPSYTPKGVKDGAVSVKIDECSERLNLLEPFSPNKELVLEDLRILIKARGKCTTDHISMAGPWLKYRGHLPNISKNLLIGAVNAFNGKTNSVLNGLTGRYGPVPNVAASYRDNGNGSIIIGDENYGEGSSREHAAMEPRYLGVRAVIARSFARIHETNLKKQGVLALCFKEDKDYDLIEEDDLISLFLEEWIPGRCVKGVIKKRSGEVLDLEFSHTYNESQMEWYRAGSAINVIGKGKIL